MHPGASWPAELAWLGGLSSGVRAVVLLRVVAGLPQPEIAERYRGPLLVMPLAGAVMVGGDRIEAGGCGVASDIAAIDFARCRGALLAQEVVAA